MKEKWLFYFIFVLLSNKSSVFTQTVNANSDSTAQATAYNASEVRPCSLIAGDALKITVYPDTSTFPSGTYLIDGEGYADLPIIGYLKVTDKTIEELTDLLKKTYLQFLRYPHLAVRPLMRVSLFGGFTQPGLYYVDPHSTLWEAVKCAGITQRRDGISKMTWERDHAIVQDDLIPLFQSHQSLYQIGFKSGDRLAVIQRPEMTGWEIFRSEMLPLLTFFVSTTLSAVTLYQTFNVLKETRGR